MNTVGANPLRLAASPVLLRELRVSGRKASTYVLRFLAALAALAVATIGYLAVTGEAVAADRSAANLQELQRLAPGVTTALVWVGFAGVVLVAPLLSAPAICDERRARTLSALATSPLSAAEIVVGHFLARFTQLAIILLVPAPMLLGLRAFGGVPAENVLGSAAVLLSLGALGIALGLMNSVSAKRSITAFFGAVAMLGVLALLPLLWMALAQNTTLISMPPQLIWSVSAPWILGVLSADLRGGAIPFVGLSTREAWAGAVVAHWAMTFLALAVASMRFRAVARTEAAGGEDVAAESDRRAGKRRLRRLATAAGRVVIWLVQLAAPVVAVLAIWDDTGPNAAYGAAGVFGAVVLARLLLLARRAAVRRSDLPVWDHPLLWRELHQPLITGRKWLVNLSAAAAALLAVIAIAADFSNRETLFPLALLIAIGHLALSAAVTPVAIATEREGRTWDALLTTPRSALEILLAKGAGGLRRLWPAPTLLLILGALFVATGAVEPVGVSFVFLVLLGPTLFLTGTGLVCAQLVRRPVPAIALNLLLALLVWLVTPAAVLILTQLVGLDASFMVLTNPLYMLVTALEGSGGEYHFEVLGTEDLTGAALVYAVFAGVYTLTGLGATLLAWALFPRFGGRAG